MILYLNLTYCIFLQLRPPQAAMYLFVIDVSQRALESGSLLKNATN